jgi:RHS repeat-associated protein
VPPIYLPLNEALGELVNRYSPYLSYVGNVTQLTNGNLTFVDRDSLASPNAGAAWRSAITFSDTGWTANTSTCAGIGSPPAGSQVLGSCTAPGYGLVATNFFRKVFTLSPPQLGYRLQKVYLERWSDNEARWIVNNTKVALSSGSPAALDVTNLITETGNNLLAVQTGNKPIYAWPQHTNATGTAWRIYAVWEYRGNPAPTITTLPAFSPGTTRPISWSAVSQDIVPSLVYEAQRASNSAFTSGVVTATTNNTGYTFSGLSDGQTYYYRACSRHPLGLLDCSAVTSSTQDATLPTASLSQPNATYQTSLSFPITWSASDPAPAGGGTASGLADSDRYMVEYKTLPGDTWEEWGTTNQTITTFTGADLTSYTFRVAARDKAGNVGVSAAVTTTVDLFPPQAGNITASPSFFSPNGDGVKDTTLITGTATGTITNWSLAIVSNTTTISSSLGTTPPISWTWAGRQTNGTIVADGAFTVTLTVTNSVGNQTTSTAPKLVYVDTAPPTPSLTVITNSTGSFNVSWSATDPATIPGQSNPAVRDFDVQMGQAVTSTIVWQGWLTGTNQSSSSYSGKVGYQYYFRVKARDRAGNQNSAWVQAGPYTISQLVTKYYLLGSQRVAMRKGSVVYYLHSDHLGSTSLTTDVGGAVVSQACYLPYGQERWVSGGSPTDFGFTGQRNDSFGLMDFNARFYSPFLGRFVSPDTIVPNPGNAQDLNRFSYVRNNPLRYHDPSGHGGGDPVSNFFQGLLYEVTSNQYDALFVLPNSPLR